MSLRAQRGDRAGIAAASSNPRKGGTMRNLWIAFLVTGCVGSYQAPSGEKKQSVTLIDSDMDGVPDAVDLDDDGTPDFKIPKMPCAKPLLDTDGDGKPDAIDFD